MPLYFFGHFLLIDFLSSGALIMNFGFALNNKSRPVKEKKQLGDKDMALKNRKRRETFLDLGDSSSDEEDERTGSYL